MRKGFNGLYGLVGERLGEDPRTGALFVFINRRHTWLKILYFDGTGLLGPDQKKRSTLPATVSYEFFIRITLYTNRF
jgi:hypothetical protein